MKKETPREEIARLNKEDKEGFYGIKHQIVRGIETRLHNQAIKIMNQLNQGWLWKNERAVHNDIYNMLLDGKSIKSIKEKYKF